MHPLVRQFIKASRQLYAERQVLHPSAANGGVVEEVAYKCPRYPVHLLTAPDCHQQRNPHH
eukprot:12489335-Heterocapsa_arctica.AAC.1